MSRSFPQVNTDRPLGGRYKIVGQLGAGGFGQTFIAEDTHLPGHPRCVVKQLKPQTTSPRTLEMARRCFNTEAQVLYQLGIHDQIPRLLAHFEENQEFYLAQEFIEGDPLTQEFASGKPWVQGRTVTLLRDILQVLTFVHEQQVIHRDLKPSNLIRRRRDRRIVLIDFGAVKQASTLVDPETGLTDVTISIGTQGYMPTEQISGKPRYSSDIYAVGVLGIQALTGVHPRCLGEDAKGEIAWQHRAAHASSELMEIINCMVRYDFRDRYPSALDALDALDSLGIIDDLEDSDGFTHSLPDTIVQIRNSTGYSGPLNGSNTQPTAAEFLEPEAEPQSTAIWNVPGESGTNSFVNDSADPPLNRSHSTSLLFGNSALGTAALTQAHLTHPKMLLAIAAGLLATIGLALTLTKTNLVAQFITPPEADRGGLTGMGSATDIATKIASTVQPPDPEEEAAKLVTAADGLMQQKKYQEALDVYSDAVEVKSDYADAYVGRCNALNALNQPDEAIVSCNDALAYSPYDPRALVGKGNAFVQQDRLIEALRLFENATYYDATLVDGWIKRGATLQKLGRSAEALRSIDQAILIYRDSAEAWAVKGEALWTLQRYEEAVVALDKALQLDPENEPAKTLRDQAREQLGR